MIDRHENTVVVPCGTRLIHMLQKQGGCVSTVYEFDAHCWAVTFAEVGQAEAAVAALEDWREREAV